MTDYINKAYKPKIKPPVITIIGMPGSGKSTISAMFPNPIVIQTDKNAHAAFALWPDDNKPFFMPEIPKANVKNKIRPSEIVLDQMRELVTEEHNFKTLVFDTVTSLNLLIEEEVTIFDPLGADTIANASGGFHKGYGTAAMKHAKIRDAAEILRKKGMTIVFLCHVGTHKVKNSPDQPEFVVYGIDIHKESLPHYVNHNDAVLYLKQIDHTKGLEENKKGQVIKSAKIKRSSERVFITRSDGLLGFIDAKNCWMMPTELDFILEDQYKPWETKNPLFEYIPFFNGGNIKQEPQEPTTQEEENGREETENSDS